MKFPLSFYFKHQEPTHPNTSKEFKHSLIFMSIIYKKQSNFKKTSGTRNQEKLICIRVRVVQGVPVRINVFISVIFIHSCIQCLVHGPSLLIVHVKTISVDRKGKKTVSLIQLQLRLQPKKHTSLPVKRTSKIRIRECRI